MVELLVLGAVAGGGLGAIGLTGVAAGAVTVGAGLLAAYVDQSFIFPALFGKSGAPPANVAGINVPGSPAGSPRWMILGAKNFVPCTYLWLRGLAIDTQGGGSGKHAKPIVQTMRVDVGIGIAEGVVASVDVLYADGRPILALNSNRVMLEDFRWAITAASGQLTIRGTDTDAPNFAALVQPNQVVSLENLTPTTLTGYWRVVSVAETNASSPSTLVLTPLQGQTPVAGTAGSEADPMRIRRLDQGGVSHTWTVQAASWITNGLVLTALNGDPLLPPYTTRGITLPSDEQIVRDSFVVGGIYRLTGWTLDSGNINGLWRVSQVAFNGGSPERYDVVLEPSDPGISIPGGVTLVFGTGTATNAATCVRQDTSGSEGFLLPDDKVRVAFYPGMHVQGPDSYLALHEPAPPMFSGYSYLSFQQWDVSPFGRLPGLSCCARSASNDTLALSISRILGRTMPPLSWDVHQLRDRSIVGYPVQGGLTGIEAMQPLMTAYGLATQDRGGVLTVLDERDLPIVAVPPWLQNARPSGQTVEWHGFIPEEIPAEDKPQRVMLHFCDAGQDGMEGVESAGHSAPNDQPRGRGDTLDIDLRPMTLWPHDAKQRANDLRRKIGVEIRKGSMNLGPSFLDVLPGHLLEFTGSNWNEETLPADTLIDTNLSLRDIEPGSVQIEVRFENSGPARLVDDDHGHLIGLPGDVSASSNAINYTDGSVTLICDENLDAQFPPVVRYRWNQTWLMRCSAAKLQGADMNLQVDMVSTTIDGPLPAIPHRPPQIGSPPIIAGRAQYLTQIVDLPPIYAMLRRSVNLGIAASPRPGQRWHGAGVYWSENGTDGWRPIGTITAPTVMGVCATALAEGTKDADTVQDWSGYLDVQLRGFVLENLGIVQYALAGTEVVSFRTVEDRGDGLYRLRGIARNRFGTYGTPMSVDGGSQIVDLHVVGEPFVLLEAFGVLNGMLWEVPGGFAAVHRRVYLAVVPVGSSLDEILDGNTPYGLVTMRAMSCRPGRPDFSYTAKSTKPWGDFGQPAPGEAIRITWGRRTTETVTIFGQSVNPPGDFEQYVITIFNAFGPTSDANVGNYVRRRITVGSGASGSTVARREFLYTPEMMLDDGFTNGDLVGCYVEQLGAGGKGPRSNILTRIINPTV